MYTKADRILINSTAFFILLNTVLQDTRVCRMCFTLLRTHVVNVTHTRTDDTGRSTAAVFHIA